ncbi:MAG: metallophosphoesterase, partial [Polyangiaceae bacterium]|nr:metallophosphoesterase [Polyangiaceae bacterium]
VDCGGDCGDQGPSCTAPVCPGNGEPSTCTTTCRCAAGWGDCDSNAQCQPGLICGKDNGAQFGMGATYDVCVPPTCTNGVLDPGETTIDCGGDCGSICPCTPTEEICDGLDNDCDGATDETFPEAGTDCNTGLPGICAAGVHICGDGQLDCEQTATPTEEICNGLDDDCDGLTDPGCPACGNGQVEAGETCDPPETCPTSCDDEDACTTDELVGSAEACDAACAYTPITVCQSADGCCPAGCDEYVDAECPVNVLPFVATELLGRPTDESITINVMAGQTMDAYFEYGTESAEPGLYTGSTIATDYPDGIIETVIDGLDADTLYYYRMRYRPSGSLAPYLAGDECTFRTQRPAESTFTFAVQSDSHQGYAAFYSDALYGITLDNVLVGQPDFLVDLGDTVSTDDATETQATVRQKYLAQRVMFDLVGASTPVFLAMGNHENEEGWNLDDMDPNRSNSLPVLGVNARKRYFLNPIPDDTFYSGNTDPLPELDGDQLREDYYAFEWGNALFVVLDPFAYTMTKPYSGAMGGEKNDESIIGDRWSWTLGDQQYFWLQDVLESSAARFKFVFAHHYTGGTSDYVRSGALGAKYCEWGGYDVDGTTYAFESHRPGWDMPVHDLFIRNGVTAFFHGHDHVFGWEVLDGIAYVELPHAANDDYGMGFGDNPENYPEADLVNNSGHLRITVAADTAELEYVRSFLPGDGNNGQVAYSHAILPCDARDSDEDGTDDCNDWCPSDPLKTDPGFCRCGMEDTDSDGDGIPDCVDNCPSDPLKTEPGACGCGWPDANGCCVDGECAPLRFMVTRVGTGGSSLSVTSTATFIEERMVEDGTLVNTLALPTLQAGLNQPLTLAGSAYVEGALKRSSDGHFVTLAGYAVAPGQTSVAQTASSTIGRVVALVAPDRTIDTSTTLTNGINGASGTNGNPRSAVTFDGTALWLVGSGVSNSGGVWHVPFGASTGTQVTGNPSSVRTCGIFMYQLYAATNVSPFYGVFTVGSGLPTGEGAAVALLPGFPTSGSSSPVDFAVLDSDPDSDGPETIYLSDDRAKSSGGGIQKWTFDGTTWSLAYTLNSGMTTGVRHLLAIESPTEVTLLAVTTSNPNSIVKVVDTGSASTATTLATAATYTAFRGLALAPVP